jgi:hypothetical protein
MKKNKSKIVFQNILFVFSLEKRLIKQKATSLNITAPWEYCHPNDLKLLPDFAK